MKKRLQFSVLLGATLCFASLSYAQVRNCDLQVTINSPGNNAVIQPNDTAWLEFTVKNNGPDPVLASDTIFYWDRTRVYLVRAGSDIAVNATKKFGQSDLGLQLINNSGAAADNAVQICIKLVNQSTVSYSSSSGPLVTFEDKDTANNWSCTDFVLKGSATTSLEDWAVSNPEQLQLYPNPANDKIHFSIDLQQTEKVYVRVKDIVGRTVLQKDYGMVSASQVSDFQLDIGTLPSGLYVVEATYGIQQQVAKLLVQH